MTRDDYTSTNPSIALIKKRHEISFNIDYISDVGFLLSELDRMEERVKELDLFLQSLTPGGSEFVNNPELCVQYVREIKQCQLNQIKKYHLRNQELESDLKLNASMLAKQCDLAREAEARVKELERALAYANETSEMMAKAHRESCKGG